MIQIKKKYHNGNRGRRFSHRKSVNSNSFMNNLTGNEGSHKNSRSVSNGSENGTKMQPPGEDSVEGSSVHSDFLNIVNNNATVIIAEGYNTIRRSSILSDTDGSETDGGKESDIFDKEEMSRNDDLFLSDPNLGPLILPGPILSAPGESRLEDTSDKEVKEDIGGESDLPIAARNNADDGDTIMVLNEHSSRIQLVTLVLRFYISSHIRAAGHI